MEIYLGADERIISITCKNDKFYATIKTPCENETQHPNKEELDHNEINFHSHALFRISCFSGQNKVE